MRGTSEIGVLLVDKTSDVQIGFIKFDPSGMLIYQNMKAGGHVYAFKPIDALLNKGWIKEPLYEKHAALLKDNPELPDEILEQEATSCAEFLNSQVKTVTLNGHPVKAHMIHIKP
jgi:hypothetical protein